jgi:hypothetical protein
MSSCSSSGKALSSPGLFPLFIPEIIFPAWFLYSLETQIENIIMYELYSTKTL